MTRLNPKLDAHELMSVFSDPDNWSLLDHINAHPAAWPELKAWAQQALTDPATAGAPPEPPASEKHKHRLRAIRPILEDEKPAFELDSPNKTITIDSFKEPLNVINDGDETSSEHEEAEVVENTIEFKVRRHMPWGRIGIIAGVLLLIGSLAAVFVTIRQHQEHAQALTSCNQTIMQSANAQSEWEKTLKQAEPLNKLSDTDVTNPQLLELLSKISQYQHQGSNQTCKTTMSANQLRDVTKANRQRADVLESQVNNLSEAIGKVKKSQQDKQCDKAKTELSKTINLAETLYKDCENKVADEATRTDLGSELDHARYALHHTTTLEAFNTATNSLDDSIRKVNDSITTKQEATRAELPQQELTQQDDTESNPQKRSQDSDQARNPNDGSAALSPSTPRMPSWGVPGQSSSPVFPDNL